MGGTDGAKQRGLFLSQSALFLHAFSYRVLVGFNFIYFVDNCFIAFVVVFT